MTYGSVCSGIEAATVSWAPLGWKAAWYSEIEAFPSAVLKHRHPKTPNLGDMTRLHEKREFRKRPIDLLVGGTPCQSFSVAGLRKGLEDARGNLALTFCALAHARRPRWVVWENVPGVLSHSSNPFGCFLAGLSGGDAPLRPGPGGWTSAGVVSGPVYGLAWRVLDAEYFGVPQRRHRVFVVGHLGDWRPSAQVLLEPQGVRRDPAAGRKARQGVAGAVRGGSEGQGGSGIAEDIAIPILEVGKRCGTRSDPRDGLGVGSEGDPMFTLQSGAQHEVAYGLRTEASGANGTPVSEERAKTLDTGSPPAVFDMRGNGDGENVPTLTGHHAGSVSDFSPMVFETRVSPDEVCPPLKAQSGESGKGDSAPILFDPNQITSKTNRSNPKPGDPCHTIPSKTAPPMLAGAVVRRLTPRECERLQGFPDDYTLIPIGGGQSKDGARYKALGNSMAVPVMRWIGERIVLVEGTLHP